VLQIMDKYAIFMISTLFFTAALTTPPRISKHYRSDYEYNHKTDAFYKFHAESRRGWSVQQVCEIEGSKLMLVETHEDVIQAHGMFKKFPDLPQHAWVAPDGKQHDSAEERPLIHYSEELEDYPSSACDAVSRSGEVDSFPCYQSLPFFCKVKASDAPYDSRCDVFGTRYEYISSVGSCYKISSAAYSWNEAYAECRAESSHLIVLNSLAESQAFQNMTRGIKVSGSRAWWFFLAGFRAAPVQANETLLFKTVFNQTLEEAGFSQWSPNEPNNAAGNELCGTIFTNNGKLNDVNCSHEYGFICEKEVQNSQ